MTSPPVPSLAPSSTPLPPSPSTTPPSLTFYAPAAVPLSGNLLAATADGSISIYDADPFVLLKTLAVHKREVSDIGVHCSGRIALTVGRDTELAMVNLVRGRRSFFCRLDEEKELVRYEGGGERFFMLGDKMVSVHCSEDTKVVQEMVAERRVLCIAPGEVVGLHGGALLGVGYRMSRRISPGAATAISTQSMPMSGFCSSGAVLSFATTDDPTKPSSVDVQHVGINVVFMLTYIGGVSCPYICGRRLDHGVLLVSYDAAGFSPIRLKENPYWFIKNSWGDSWGEQGCYKICRGPLFAELTLWYPPWLPSTPRISFVAPVPVAMPL